MTSSTISTGNIVTDFQSEVRREYVRDGIYGPFVGNTQNSVFQTNKNLKKTSIALIAKITGAGVRGSTQLSGSETAISNFDALLTPKYVRQGVLIDNEENEKAEFDLFSEGRPALMNWMMELKRDLFTQSLLGIEAGGTYFNYGGGEDTGATGSSAASAANMDTWNTNNQDRILYGAAKGNLTAGDHTTSLATIDTTNDKLDTDALTLLKRMAADASPLIRPIQVTGDVPMYVYFVGKYGFRDLQSDSAMQQANREARPRDVKANPIFNGGDMIWDNIIIKEVVDMDKFIDGTGSDPFDGIWGAGAAGDSLATGGDSSSRVGVGFLCGAQAVGFGIGRTAEFKRRTENDYDFLNGVGIQAKQDIKKLFYNNKQHGVLTHFHSASLDS